MFQAWKANVKFLKIFLQPAKHAHHELDLFGSHTKLLIELGMDLSTRKATTGNFN
jgi:hypothetical protein